MQIVDTHSHLNLLEEKGIHADQALLNASERGVSSVIQIATDLKSTRYNAALSSRYNNNPEKKLDLYWTGGLHPEAAKNIETLDELFSIIREYRKDPNFIGIGETGLDYFHTTEYEKEQKESFQKHLDLAVELSLPVVLHLRDGKTYSKENTRALTDAYEMIAKKNNIRGVLHCYTYGPEEARPFIDMGWFVSYSGIVTYKNAEILQEGASSLPLECLLVETDCPYLTPVPNRGKINEPAYVADTLDFIANLRNERNGEDPDTVKNKIFENSIRFMNLKNTADGKTYA